MNDNADNDPRLYAIPDIHGHAKGEHKAFTDERPIPLSARMLFLWFYHACRRGWPRFLMVSDHMNYLTFEDPAAINLVRRALKLAQAGDLYGAAETASVEVGHAAVVSEGLRRGMRYSLGAEVDNDPRSRPDAQNIVDAMKPDGMIRSVHFLTVDHPTHGSAWNWPFDNPEFSDVFDTIGTEKTWELYMATLLDALERLPGNIVGHFYVPAIFGHWPDDATLDGYENQLVDVCETRGIAIEVNTRFLYREHTPEEKERYLAAHRRLLRKCKARNVGVAIGSDAHSPKDQGRAFNTILALLDECEINEIVFPIAGRLARVALRVERKSEPAVPVAEVPEAVAGDDRKSVRKARTSDVPARPKDSSSKRDDGSSNVPEPADEPAVKKARPKRSRNRGAARTDESEATQNEADAASTGPAPGPIVDEPGANGRAPDEMSSATASEAGSEPENGGDIVLVTLTETIETTSEIAAVLEPITAEESASDVFAAAAVDDVTYVADDTADQESLEGTPDASEAIQNDDRVLAAAEAQAGAVEAGTSDTEPSVDRPADGGVTKQVGATPRVRRKASPAARTKPPAAPVRAKAKPAPKKAVRAAKPLGKKSSAAGKTAAKKSAAKKPVGKKAAKKVPAKKAAARGGAKKSSAPKAASKKPAVKKPPSKRR